jgi:hypothetical protein
MSLRTLQFSALLLAFSLSQAWLAKSASAQRSNETAEAEANEEHSQWYYGNEEAPKRTIAQQKAALRAEQRMDRLASLKWYGFTPGRPTAATMPFTSMYSPAWTRPGGQPFAWYTGYQQPIVYGYPYGHRYW